MCGDEDRAEVRFPEVTAFEAALAALTPRAAALDRETIFFQAGQAAALRDLDHRPAPWSRWGWPAAFSAMTAAAATLLTMLCLRTEPGAGPPVVATAPEIAAVPAAPIVPPDYEPRQGDRPADGGGYWRLREEILRQGFSAHPAEKVALTETIAVAAGPLTYRELLDQIMQEKDGGL